MRPSAEHRGGRRRGTGLAMLVLALGAVLAACGEEPPATPTDGGPPYLIRGRVVDKFDVAVPTKLVQISLVDHANADPGQPLTVISQTQHGVALDGSFEARLEITPEIAAFAAKTDNVASFDVVAIGTDGNVVAVYVFSRTIAQSTWAGDVPFLKLRSEGASELDEHPTQQ
jgi:hypothetical protein